MFFDSQILLGLLELFYELPGLHESCGELRVHKRVLYLVSLDLFCEFCELLHVLVSQELLEVQRG